MPFDQHDLLRLGGVEEGDIVPLFTLVQGNSDQASTTSTTFTDAFGLMQHRLDTGTLIEDDWDTFTNLAVSVNVGTDETAAIRVQTRFGSEWTTTVDNITATGIAKSGWVQQDPTALGTEEIFDMQIRSDPGTNSTNFIAPTFSVGVQL